MEVVALLKAEIKALEKIFQETREFYGIPTHDGFLTALHNHQKRRNFLFQGYVLLEEKIVLELKKLSTSEKEKLKSMISPLIKLKEEKIASLLKLDNSLISRIEAEQHTLDMKITESKRSREQLTRFSSQRDSKSGKSLDVKL